MTVIRMLGRRFVFAFQFLTRIPIPVMLNLADDDMVGTLPFFPVVGLFIGLVTALICELAFQVSSMLSIVAAVLVPLALSGGLHMDGLADVCDAWFSGRDRDRMLEIMKDSRIGAFGALGIVFSLLLKLSLYHSAVFEYGGWGEVFPLIIAVSLSGKLAMVCAAAQGEPARLDGLGRGFIAPADWLHLAIAAALTLCAMLLVSPAFALLPVLPAVAVSTTATWRYKKKLGGLTGDTLGAISEITEVFTLLAYIGYGFVTLRL